MADGPIEASSAGEDFRRELAARRKDLEREFADKARELKAQHQRRMDQLERDRLEWEAYKRSQTKEMADRAEKLRRNAENAETKVRVTTENLRELDELRAQVKELERGERQAKKAHAELEARATTVEAGLRRARALLAWFALVSIAGPVLWLFAGGAGAGPDAFAVAAATLALALLLTALRGRASKPR